MFHEQALNFAPYRKQYVASVLKRIHALKPKVAKLSDDDLRRQSLELRFRARSGEAPEKLVAPAFALVQEASHRVLGMRHYKVQLMSGINLTSKCVVEMATGEGKTLTAVLPLYLHGLYGKGAHLATANDYLARRDGAEMEPIFSHLSMSVGIVQHESEDPDRKEAYARDVTYGTMTEFGFDFLRDRMKIRMLRHASGEVEREKLPDTVHRKLNFILVDEADSIMVDDASTPLIIGAMPSPESEYKVRLYRWAARFAAEANEGREFRHVEHKKKIELTESGRHWTRKVASETDVAGQATVDQFEFMERAIKVERDYFRDRNYVLDAENEVTIVDENTGRLAVGRFWQDGLHQAIQAREGVEVTAPLSSAARVSVQSLVTSYPNRAGMTGTGISSKREFRKAFKMQVVPVPTRKPCVRKKKRTVYARDEQTKLRLACEKIRELSAAGQPVLVGNRSVQKSETLAKLLDEMQVPYTLLNARNEAYEAAIVECAGEPGTVTLSTSMAGRGTDIKLFEGVAELGGLHVVITELNDSTRIDRQLIGRCARQGDPGSYQIFLSDDDQIFDAKNLNRFWLGLMKKMPGLPPEWFFRRGQKQVANRKMRDRLKMLHQERKRLRKLRQAGLDPVLDVVD